MKTLSTGEVAWVLHPETVSIAAPSEADITTTVDPCSDALLEVRHASGTAQALPLSIPNAWDVLET